MSELTRRDFLKTTGAVAAGAVLGLGLGEAPPESQAQTAGDGGGGKQSAGSVLSLPKGGGAVQGIGETFSPNP
ncbi:MAG: twin-arginine translocation signal domain-containing protein, partial [Nitrospira sp.]|nr:twin-arginine translocation signal domain-containing protein [Nitrospira sp.]